MKRFFGISAALTTALTTALVFAVIVIGQNSFYNEAAQSNMAEIELSRLALQKSNNEDIKQYAQQMINDHTAAGEKLRQLAANKNITLPQDVNSKQRNAKQKLDRLSGEKFDSEFVKQMVKDHEAAVRLFERQSERGEDADTKAFAAETLPTLRSHLEMARSMSGDMSNMNRGNMNTNRDMNMNSNRNMNSNSNRNMNMNSNNRNMNSNGNMNNNRDMDSNNSNMNMNSNNRNIEFESQYEFKLKSKFKLEWQYEYEFKQQSKFKFEQQC